eukprot:11509654-Alexandrium_andersonii.AAC.1
MPRLHWTARPGGAATQRAHRACLDLRPAGYGWPVLMGVATHCVPSRARVWFRQRAQVRLGWPPPTARWPT